MHKELLQYLRTGFILLMLLTLFTGVFYPLLITGIAQLLFPWQANGSLLKGNGKVLGSLYIGQEFTAPKYFWGRPSSTPEVPYNGIASAGSNLGPSNPELWNKLQTRANYLQNEKKSLPLPVDLLTSSASGLDPQISPQAAFYQIFRIAKVRNLPETELAALIYQQIEPRSLGFLGEPRVNVLQLNLALDNLEQHHAAK